MIKFVSILMLFISMPLLAQDNPYENKNRLRLDPKKPLKIEFSFAPLNKNPQAEDQMWIIIKDFKSQKLVKVQLQETGPDTSVFMGNYSITWIGGGEFVPEIYLAPQELLKSGDELKKVDKLIKEGLLLRKPYFLRTEKGVQYISVYENREQALRAFQEYRKTLQGKPVVDPAALDAQKKAQLSGEAAKLAGIVTAQELARKVLGDTELQKKDQGIKAFKALSAKEKEARKAEALRLSQEGMREFSKGQNQQAADLLLKSVNLDPETSLYRFQYGQILFALDRNNESIVTLRLADGPPVNPNERDFYIGINLYKLKENDSAIDAFDHVQKSGDKVFAANATFYMGAIEYSREKWDASQKHFEETIDISDDPKLSAQAETYIEQIAQIKQVEAERAKRVILSVTAGVNYDTNILLTPNLSTEAAVASDVAGIRGLLLATAEYRPVYTDRHEFSGILSYTDMYSYDTSLRPSSTLQKADPIILTVTAPYKYKGQVGKTGVQIGITPGYDSTRMDLEATGTRSEILTSEYVKIDGTIVMSEDWFSNYYLELRRDHSKIAVTSIEEDSNAARYTLGTTQTLFVDKKKTEAWIGEGILVNNVATGDNQYYNKIEVAGSYLTPSFWSTSWTTKVDYAYTNYTNSSAKRADTNTVITTGWRKPINEALSASATLSYTLNASNTETYRYDKYGIMTLLTWNKAF